MQLSDREAKNFVANFANSYKQSGRQLKMTTKIRKLPNRNLNKKQIKKIKKNGNMSFRFRKKLIFLLPHNRL